MTIAIHLPRDTEQRLDLLAAKTGRTKTEYLQEFIRNGLDEAEDYYLAASVLERVRKGEEAVHSSADVRRDLGLDD
ncbi:type II toxin-antitoxin system RelB family antitoxin [Thiocapsa rosea]|uniref:RHH-type rel operon transcriptional repressor/antitoxin RelB n=1 Tax=Thiocapsa rosea TaxID=69360 RepID=A0A495V6D2_9GAMM|nr:ribbon-helix-helix protein, CopG family [Thiocapsa rosea]RKT44952.1 RHH-type rel operon transcriptional repressor/antitoxin RelB [Thiocapsa rosea]